MPQGPRPKAGANAPPAPPTIEQFLDELTFRGIAIPYTHLDTSFSQSYVEHKPVDRDGAFVETTGTDPIRVNVTAMFSNHIVPGKDASWEYGKLYPEQFRKVLAAIQDRKKGVLKHPELGQFDAVPIDWKHTTEPQNRSGVQIQISFLETIEPSFDYVAVATNATASSASYELALSALPATVPLPPDKPNFEDMINGVKAAIDGTALQISQAMAKIDRVLYQIDRINESLDNFQTVLTVDARIKGERLYEAALKMRQTLNQSFVAKIRRFRVPEDMTMVALVQRLGNDVPTLLQLNPSLVGMKGARVPQGTWIRYERVIG